MPSKSQTGVLADVAIQPQRRTSSTGMSVSAEIAARCATWRPRRRVRR